MERMGGDEILGMGFSPTGALHGASPPPLIFVNPLFFLLAMASSCSRSLSLSFFFFLIAFFIYTYNYVMIFSVFPNSLNAPPIFTKFLNLPLYQNYIVFEWSKEQPILKPFNFGSSSCFAPRMWRNFIVHKILHKYGPVTNICKTAP